MPDEGPARRKRLPSTDAITSRSEQSPCNLRIACLPACSCHSPGQGGKATNISTRSYLEGRAFRTRHQHEGQVPGRPYRGVDLVKHGVVVSRIVVKRNESSGSAQRGERERVSHRTMPPSNPLLVLLGSVLCVMDQQASDPRVPPEHDLHVRVAPRRSPRLRDGGKAMTPELGPSWVAGAVAGRPHVPPGTRNAWTCSVAAIFDQTVLLALNVTGSHSRSARTLPLNATVGWSGSGAPVSLSSRLTVTPPQATCWRCSRTAPGSSPESRVSCPWCRSGRSSRRWSDRCCCSGPTPARCWRSFPRAWAPR